MIAHIHCIGSLGGAVASRLGFAEQECADVKGPILLSARQRLQESTLLLLGTMSLQAPVDQAVIDTHAYTHTRINLTDLLHRQHITHRVEPGSAIGRIGHHAHETQLPQFHDLLMCETLMLIPVYHARQAFPLGKIPGGLPDHPMFFTQHEIHMHDFSHVNINPNTIKLTIVSMVRSQPDMKKPNVQTPGFFSYS